MLLTVAAADNCTCNNPALFIQLQDGNTLIIASNDMLAVPPFASVVVAAAPATATLLFNNCKVAAPAAVPYTLA